MSDTKLDEYFSKGPYKFWENYTSGEMESNNPLVHDLVNVFIGDESMPPKLKEKLVGEKPPEWGTYYSIKDIPQSDYMIATSTKLPSHGTGWQQGLTRVKGYYFYNKKTQETISLEDVAKQVTNSRVKFFFYDEELEERSERVFERRDEEGKFWAVCIFNPRNLLHVLGAIHEIGHINMEENFRPIDREIGVKANFHRELARVTARQKEVEKSGLPEEEIKQALLKLEKEFASSKANERMMGAVMAKEYEVWLSTFKILGKTGLANIFEKYPKELEEHVIFSIKTRIDGQKQTNP